MSLLLGCDLCLLQVCCTCGVPAVCCYSAACFALALLADYPVVARPRLGPLSSGYAAIARLSAAFAAIAATHAATARSPRSFAPSAWLSEGRWLVWVAAAMLALAHQAARLHEALLVGVEGGYLARSDSA